MFEIHPSSWPVAFDATDTRNEFHRTALAEARAATDWLAGAPSSARPGPTLVARLRLALGGRTRTAAAPCTCSA